jgi:hypothetical protein
LYGRGIARLKKGDKAGGNADIAAAKALRADVANVFAAPASKPPAISAPKSSAASASAADCARAETHWKSVENIKTLAAYEDHLARFPNCEFAGLAAAHIQALKK